jgi:hypothetical protein
MRRIPFLHNAQLPPSRPDVHDINLILEAKIPTQRSQYELQALKSNLQENLERKLKRSLYCASITFAN